MTSTPAPYSSSASLGVMPIPPAAFSPLATTQSSACSSRRPGSSSRTTRRPVRATTSPMKRIAVTFGDHTFLMTDSRVVVPRWVQLVMLPLAVLGAWALLRAAGAVVLLFVVAALVALLLVIVLSVYMLLYGDKIGAAVRSVLPWSEEAPEDDYPTRVQRAVFGYVRGQFLFSVIMGTSAGVVLWVLGSLGIFPDGRTYALFFGAWYAFAELIPYVGPAIGAGPPVLISLFSSEPLDALWLTIAFTALQQIEGHIVAPTVFSQALRINPILVIAALLMGGQLYGFIGAFVALPVAAILRESVDYFRQNF